MKCKTADKAKKGKYVEWLTPNGLLKLESWARDGLIDEQIAKNIGISRSTLNEWKNKYSVISDALKKGKEIVDIQVENALFKRAIGYTFEEVKIEESAKDGRKITKTVKEVVPDTTAQIFWLKNRRPSKWRDRQEDKDNTQTINVIHNIPRPPKDGDG